MRSAKVTRMAEIGVYRGDFASQILQKCGSIDRYYMIDPWRHLDRWNKPANVSDSDFKQFLAETVSKTDFADDRRVILQGETNEVVDQMQDEELDFAYVDGDHTLRGITIDLVRVFPKVRVGGWIGGDDFSGTIWQHRTAFEPTLVFPFAVYFAEAMGARIYSLPNAQFLIEKSADRSFAFVDIVGSYLDTSLGTQFRLSKVVQLKLLERFSLLSMLVRTVSRKRPPQR